MCDVNNHANYHALELQVEQLNDEIDRLTEILSIMVDKMEQITKSTAELRGDIRLDIDSILENNDDTPSKRTP
jgi:predicted  nucleic acid-binding Zn-ribbon protein